jgi:hypothetical protein
MAVPALTDDKVDIWWGLKSTEKMWYEWRYEMEARL